MAGKMWSDAKQRAVKKGLPFNIAASDITIPEFCPILGIKLERGRGKVQPGSPSLDRVVPELGYTRGNIRVISHRANRIKDNATAQELEMIAAWIRRAVRHKH